MSEPDISWKDDSQELSVFKIVVEPIDQIDPHSIKHNKCSIMEDLLRNYQSKDSSINQKLACNSSEMKDMGRSQRGVCSFGPKKVSSGGERVNNTIFKTGLSEYRKSIVEYIKLDSSLDWLPVQIGKIYKGVKNQSIFPKLNLMVRLLNLNQQVKTRWGMRISKLLEKKKELMNKGVYVQSRYDELAKTIDKMNQCIEDDSFYSAFERYWGKYKQEGKYVNSRQNVQSFERQFKIIMRIHQEDNKTNIINQNKKKRRERKKKINIVYQESIQSDLNGNEMEVPMTFNFLQDLPHYQFDSLLTIETKKRLASFEATNAFSFDNLFQEEQF